MSDIKRITTSELLSAKESFKIGEKLLISGTLFTARDAAHKLMCAAIERGEESPIPLKSSVIYYAGPSAAKPPLKCGSCGPTTSKRMDPFTPLLMDCGLRVMIGKGERDKSVSEAIKKHKGLYLLAVGGAGALAAKSIKDMSVIAYPELGTESIKRLTVEDFPVFVGIDSQGNSIFDKNT